MSFEPKGGTSDIDESSSYSEFYDDDEEEEEEEEEDDDESSYSEDEEEEEEEEIQQRRRGSISLATKKKYPTRQCMKTRYQKENEKKANMNKKKTTTTARTTKIKGKIPKIASSVKRNTTMKKTVTSPIVNHNSNIIPYHQTKKQHEILDELNKTILYQEVAMQNIMDLLRSVFSRPQYDSSINSNVRDRIFKRILSGPSGVGKTETVKMIRRILGMDENGPYAAQYISIDGSVYKDITQLNRLTGSGPGYAACETKNSLVDDLITSVSNEIKPPNILLFIDEVDKAHKDFMSIINGLVEEGTIRSSRGDTFVLPFETQLIILFTSNYGWENIARMKVQDEVKAVRFVEASMAEQGLQPNSIERFGSHIIFYPIEQANMAEVVSKKLHDMLSKPSQLTLKYGKIDYRDAIQCITEFILQISTPERGIRNSLKNLSEALTPLIVDAFYKLEEIPRARLRQILSDMDADNQRLRLFKETLSLAMFDHNSDIQDNQRMESGFDNHYIVKTITSDVKNRKRLEVFRTEGSGTNQSIHAFGISQGDTILNCVIVPLIVQHYTITQYDSDDSCHIIEELKNRYETLENNYTTLLNEISRACATKNFDNLIQIAATKKRTRRDIEDYDRRMNRSGISSGGDDDDGDDDYGEYSDEDAIGMTKVTNMRRLLKKRKRYDFLLDNNSKEVEVDEEEEEDNNKKCTMCDLNYPISYFITVSSGNKKKDGTRGKKRITTRNICRPCRRKK